MSDLDLSQWLSYTIAGISVGRLAGAFACILAGYISKRIVSALLSRLAGTAGKTRTEVDDILIDALTPPLSNALLLIGFWLSLMLLPVPEEPVNIARFVGAFFRAASVVLIVWFGVRFVDRLGSYWERPKTGERQWYHDVAPLFRKSGKVFLWIVGGVFVAQNLGYSVSALMAGLGIGGAAVAFASKDTIANLFGSIVVLVDRPFRIGDWVEIGSHEGTVEEIGLRVTRVRTFANSLITIPNALLTNTSINNWSRMQKRRIKTTIGVTYSTTPDQMRQAVETIREILQNDERIRQDFFLVNFTDFGASSLDILLYCFTVTTSWADHLQVRQEILLKIMDALTGLGLEIAFPTRTLHLESAPEGFVLPARSDLPD